MRKCWHNATAAAGVPELCSMICGAAPSGTWFEQESILSCYANQWTQDACRFRPLQHRGRSRHRGSSRGCAGGGKTRARERVHFPWHTTIAAAIADVNLEG